MRYTVREVLTATVFLIALLIVAEHAGAFSKVIGQSAQGYATAVTALQGHQAAARGGRR